MLLTHTHLCTHADTEEEKTAKFVWVGAAAALEQHKNEKIKNFFSFDAVHTQALEQRKCPPIPQNITQLRSKDLIAFREDVDIFFKVFWASYWINMTPHSRSGFKQLTKSWIIQSAATPKSFFRKAKLPLLYLLLLCFTLDCDHQWGVRCLPVRRRWIQPGVITKQHIIRSCCSSEKYIISDSKLSVSPQRNSHSFW